MSLGGPGSKADKDIGIGCTALFPLGIHTPQINIQQSPDSEKFVGCGTGATWGWGQTGTRDVGRKLAPGEGKAALLEDSKAAALGQRRGLEAALLDSKTWIQNEAWGQFD